MARLIRGKGLVVHGRYAQGRPLNEIDSNVLAKEPLQENPCYFTLKGTSISSCIGTSQQRFWTEFPQAGPKAIHHTVMKKKRLDFARRHRHWSLTEWKKVLFFYLCAMKQFEPYHAMVLHFISINFTINGPKYVKMLKELLKLYMHIHGCTIFVQDGAPFHRSQVVTNFLRKN